MRAFLRGVTVGSMLLAMLASTPARASGLCDLRYILPVTAGASWTFAGEAQPRTRENIRTDSFEVHSSYPTE